MPISQAKINELIDLKEWATPRQKQVIDAVIKNGGVTSAARKLDICQSTVSKALKYVVKKAALQGHSPAHDMFHTTPEPFVSRGQSTYYDGDGNIRGQWVKTKLDDQKREMMIVEAVAAMTETLPRLKPTPAPKHGDECLLNVFTLTDCHIGMLAWEKEGGHDWDLKIAETELVGCFSAMLHAAPDAHTCVIAQLGDFLHYDGLTPVTPTSGHILDADSRFSKMVQTAIRVLRQVTAMALKKHKKVVMVIAEGNHDMASSVWLRQLFKCLYENEPRVQIVDRESPYYAYQHGETALFWHHSHMSQFETLPLKFATEFHKIWGKTRFRYGHTGDKHHKMEKEFSGVIMNQHPTLASRDAYASRHGWSALRSATAITYHSSYGEVSRNSVNPDMLKPLLKSKKSRADQSRLEMPLPRLSKSQPKLAKH